MEKVQKLRTYRAPKGSPPRSRSSLAEELEVPAREETLEPGVRVIFGASVQEMPLAGLTVSRARELAAAILQAPPRGPILLNGRPARTTQMIAVGDTLEFVHHAGEKGAGGERSR